MSTLAAFLPKERVEPPLRLQLFLLGGISHLLGPRLRFLKRVNHVDLRLWHVDYFNILGPKIEQFESIIQSLLQCLESH